MASKGEILARVGALALVFSNCQRSATKAPELPTTTPSPVRPTETPTAEVVKLPRATTTEIPTATAQETAEILEVRVEGVPQLATSVEVATSGEEVNTIGLGTEAFLAEPGGLMVGPDFGYTGDKGPFGQNKGGWETMYESLGMIQPYSALSSEKLIWEPPVYWLVDEGGWALFQAGKLSLEVDGMKVELPDDGTGHIFAIRGKYPDGKQDSDLNRTVKLIDYVPGQASAFDYNAGADGRNMAFLSEEQMRDMVANGHWNAGNCGAEGCSRIRVVYLDLNTKAFGIWEHKSDRGTSFEDAWDKAGKDWMLIYKNY